VALDSSGIWYLLVDGISLGTGKIAVDTANTPVTLLLSMKGTAISATIAPPAPAQPVQFSTSHAKYTAGMAALGSGYHPASFDDFALAPL
jgi:hypothetical protein